MAIILGRRRLACWHHRSAVHTHLIELEAKLRVRRMVCLFRLRLPRPLDFLQLFHCLVWSPGRQWCGTLRTPLPWARGRWRLGGFGLTTTGPKSGGVHRIMALYMPKIYAPALFSPWATRLVHRILGA